MDMCLGLDTSCYTTSAALCGAGSGTSEGCFFQMRRLLDVTAGKRGLQQSEAVFQHTARLPDLVKELLDGQPEARICCVCASVRPRPHADSYMPVFRVGEGFGRAIAAAMRVPFFETTHQQGHIRAARIDTPLKADTPFLAMHLSGGTTELLCSQNGEIHLLGGTRDLHAGQLIDRVGVALGLPFPAGPHLERLAMEGTAASLLPASLRGMDCHFSGAEAQALRWLQEGALSPTDIAAEVFSCVARTVSRMLLAGCAQAGVTDVLLGGGVIASQVIRQAVTARVAKRNGAIRIFFARPEYAGDNAVGVALSGLEAYQKRRDLDGGNNH